jgi:putative membrane protein insertion efficiency factor
MKCLGLWLIRLYQRCISPLFGPVCKYSPSCSHYTYQSIERHGLIAGVVMGGKRLCRCNPWALGGPDPVPEQIRWSWRGPLRKGPPPTYDFAADRAIAVAGGAPLLASSHTAAGALAPTAEPANQQRVLP